MSEARLLTPQETARYISVRVDALPRLVRQGRIPKPDYKLGLRSPRWDKEALDAWITGDTASTDTRIAVRAAADAIRAEGRAQREARARRRLGQDLPLRTVQGAAQRNDR